MSSWAEDADNNTAISNDTFSAEKILSQSEDGRKIIKEITEFKIVNEKSVKIIRKISVQTKTVRINKNVKARRGWAKYGDCEGQAAGFKEQGVVNIDENQPFELAGQEETVAPTQKGVGNLLNMDTFSILRQLRTRMTSGEITQEQYDQERARILKKDAPTRSGDAEADVDGGKGGPTGYVPPHMRNRDGGAEPEQENATLRVTNVSQDASRDDLMELFRGCGAIARISVPTDRETGLGRGFVRPRPQVARKSEGESVSNAASLSANSRDPALPRPLTALSEMGCQSFPIMG